MRGEDRLSDLPEHILHHIFSSFTTKDLITTTCLLSKKWQHFWVSHPYLDLHIENYNFVDSDSDSNIDDAGSRCSPKFVDKSLYGHGRGGSDLERFSLRWLECNEGPRLKSWIVKAMNRKVKEVEIVLGLDGSMFTIPAKVFAKGSSVRAIKLEACFRILRFLIPHPMLSAPNLRTLELVRMKLPKGDSKKEVAMICPVLETLILKDCYYMHLKVLGLSLGKLKKLEIENTGNNRSSCGRDKMAIPSNCLGVCKLELHTPNLTTFIYKGELFEYFSFGDLVALIDVDVSLSIFFISCPKFSGQLSVFNKWEDSRYKFLKGLNGARNLALGTVQVCSSKVPNTLHDVLTSYTNLRKLELRLSPIEDISLSWLASLLYCCPSLETLVLHDVKLCQRKEEFVLPLCPMNHLKYVALTGLEGHDNELEFLRFLFNGGVNLDLMVINGGGLKDSKFGKADLLNFHEKLMVLSQEFPNVKISFQIRKSNVVRFDSTSILN
ncbi:hypothetical protein Sjap_025956 [Stephania japonica]|uniref:F-box domain-containing protein n=1 Tax=Stephania japonica TaxID=461633 RepID=A0AAP0HK08_9MAGN